jgi:glycosyltransferase involved in cell wall biosynthesis
MDQELDKKTVLLISQDFPPQGWTSSKRSGGMAKYLKDYGWHPIVLCQRWTPANCVYDPSIVTNIPADVSFYAIDVKQLRPLSLNYAKEVVYRILFPQLVPTDFFRRALKALPNILSKHRVDAIWATAPMACNHALADWASRKWNCPWVADFRDVHQFKSSGLKETVRTLRIYYDNRMLKSASEITTVSEGFARTLRTRHSRNVRIIPNGFDPEILADDQIKTVKNFNLVYTGGINLGKPEFGPLLDAVGLLIKAGKLDPKDISIQFYGAKNERRLKSMFENHEFRNFVQDCGHVPREKLLNIQRSAAILLQATYPGTGTLSSKIYEYLAARRPILALPQDHDGIDQLLLETKAGVSYTSVDEIAQQLLKWYQEWKSSNTINCQSTLSAIMKYSQKVQARQLSQLLNDLTYENK